MAVLKGFERRIATEMDNFEEDHQGSLPEYQRSTALQAGGTSWGQLRSDTKVQESEALERLVLLKTQLSGTMTDDFWPILLKSIASILGAQHVLCSKRLLRDSESANAQIATSKEPGPYLKGIAYYHSDGPDEELLRDFSLVGKIESGTSGQEERLRVPYQISKFVSDRAAEIKRPIKVSVGIPLFNNGVCFAHLCVFWSDTGNKERCLDWGFIEMTLRALEDLVTRRLTNAHDLRRPRDSKFPPNIYPRSLTATMQSLQPYARSLSHELRTPMHGVVGMLDIMHATVQEALEDPPNNEIAQTFHTLRENIEAVQDSSRRAVEAADNVVHAYDFNMQVPDTPDPPGDEELSKIESISPRTSLSAYVPTSAGVKRQRAISTEPADQEPNAKHRAIDIMQSRSITPHTATLRSVVQESSQITGVLGMNRPPKEETDLPLASPSTPGGKSTRVRDLMHLVVNESLRFGGRPDSAIATETEAGEIIEVRNRTSSGEASTKTVEWAVDQSVPDDIFVDERDFAKLISVLFLNALKFTDHGFIKIRATLSPKSRYILINVTDTGSGIPTAFRPYLFKAFSREDDSLTRQNEGLGLGLMVAKGVARRVGGDLICVRSDTEGPSRGSEFELRLPLTPNLDTTSRPSTPSRTPTPLPIEVSTAPGVLESGILDMGKAELAKSAVVSTEELLRADPSFLSEVHVSNPPHTVDIPYEMQNYRSRSQVRPISFDRKLAQKYPLNVMVAEDNRINRKLLVNMLGKLGYTEVHEAFDGTEAVRLMEMNSRKPADRHIDVILMDLWMPNMDGYEAAERILAMERFRKSERRPVKILAVTADVTDIALGRAREVGMLGFMTKPYKLKDLERLIIEYYSVEAK